MKLVLVTLLILSGVSAFADQTTKYAKLVELVKIQGREEYLTNQMAAYDKQAEEFAANTLSEYRKQFPEADDLFFQEVSKAYQDALAPTKESGSVKKMTDAWIEFYGSQLTESEIEQLLAFYKSSLGQKDLSAVRFARSRWLSELIEWDRLVMEPAIKRYYSQVRQIYDRALKRQAAKKSSNKK